MYKYQKISFEFRSDGYIQKANSPKKMITFEWLTAQKYEDIGYSILFEFRSNGQQPKTNKNIKYWCIIPVTPEALQRRSSSDAMSTT